MKPSFDRLRPLSPRNLSIVHSSSVEILIQTGMWVEAEDARQLFGRHGCKVDGQRVFFSPGVIADALQTVPSRFQIRAVNRKHDLDIGGKKFAFGPTGGAPFCLDRDGTQRTATLKDLDNFVQLTQSLDVLQFQRNDVVTPGDIPAPNVALYALLSVMRNSDKPFFIADRHSLDMVCIRFGITRDKMRKSASKSRSYGGYGIVNPLSPLALSKVNTDVIQDLAGYGIPLMISPVPMAGMTAPVTLPGLLVQQNAEILGALVFTQLVSPGAPVLYGCLGTTTDMRTAVGAIGASETRLIGYAAAQIARMYKIPSRGDVGLSDSLSIDYQAGAESALSLYNAIRSGINVLPGIGALGSWNYVSYEKFLLDAELAQSVQQLVRPLKFTHENMAIDLIQQVGPRGSFIAEDHTYRHFREETYSPTLFARAGYHSWAQKGRKETRDWAHEKVTQLLNDFTPPPLDSEMDRDLVKYVRQNAPVLAEVPIRKQ